MSSPIRTGFVGLSTSGWASLLLGPTLLQNDKFILNAVSTTNEESAKASAEKQGAAVGHHVEAYHGSTQKIANDPQVDFVAVAVKSVYHRDALLPVIEAGKDFFIEWPAGKSTAETKEFAQAAQAKKLRTLVGCQGIQSPFVKKASLDLLHDETF